MDPDTRRLVLFAVGLGVVLLSLIAASAIMGHRGTEVPVITADSRPVREKPINPGGLKVDGADSEVFSGGSDTSNAKLTPPAETPDTKGLHSPNIPTPPAHSASVTTLAPPSAALPAAIIPSAISPPAISPLAIIPPAPVPPVPSSPGPAANRLAAVASAPPASKPVPVKPPVPAATAETHAVVPGHQPMVQLAAVKSEDSARQEWDQLVKRMPDLLKGHQPNYSKTERDGHTFWRIRTTGFTDAAQARSFCEHVRAKGGGCAVTEF